MIFLENRNLTACELTHADATEFSVPDSSSKVPLNQAKAAAGGAVTVLLADERADIRESFAAHFPPEDGIRLVGEATKSGEVLGLVERLRPHVVVIAMRMAVRLGVETVRHILRMRWSSEVLILLPNRGCPFVRHFAVAGASGYLTQEDTADVVAEKIRQARAKPQATDRLQSSKFTSATETMRLTSREEETLRMIAEGCTNKGMASEMGISIKTIEKHRQHLMDKLGIHETATLTRYALYVGLVH